MKRFLAIPLMFLYIFSVSGAMIQIHFCQQKVESWSINTTAQPCCCETSPFLSNQGSITDEDCCSDQTIVLKTEGDQLSVSAFQILFSHFQADLPARITFNTFQLPADLAVNTVYYANAPPGLWQGIPLFKLLQRFTYYG